MTQQTARDSDHFDVIVVGAGHAGCEAALAAARMGCRTLLITMNLDLVATMPCNPSIGSPAKGQIVREIDALGGEMARNTDRTFIQIRMLNPTRGPAVQALRAQVDKRLYALSFKQTLEATPGLYLKQGRVAGLLVKGGRMAGVRLSLGQRYDASQVILASGTFLNGRILVGDQVIPAGRAGEFASQGLSLCLAELGLDLGRHQTDTPPRVDARTIDYEQTEPQYGCESPRYMSFDGPPDRMWQLPIHPAYPIERQTAWRTQVPCYLVRTNAKTHRIIQDNLVRSPIAPGALDAHGPRYCPSIESKVIQFPDKTSHQLFLEPEGWATSEVYVQGLFTGLPIDVQLEMLHSIPALKHAEMMRPGYGIDYDYVRPHQITASLEVRTVPGLWLAGQINGTSGYEEAACQGLMAGINAAQRVMGNDSLVLGRDQAMIGVLIDDMVTKEISEPYRMMTSRAEHRMLLRQDNADLRLGPIAHRLGLISDTRHARTEAKRAAIAEELDRLSRVYVKPMPKVQRYMLERGQPELRQPILATQLLKRPRVDYGLIKSVAPPPQALACDTVEQIEIALRYEGYITKEKRRIARAERLEHWQIPESMDYADIVGLRQEARERLVRHRPETLGQASRVQGVNPADISLLMVHLRRWRRPDSDQ